MNFLASGRDFEPFDISHWVVMIVTIGATWGVCKLMRSGAEERVKWWARVGMASVLFGSVLADPVLAWLRYGEDPLLARELIMGSSLPLYLCDVVAVVLGLALLQKNQRMAEIGYLWGIAGTVQGLVTPTLYFDWTTPEFYAFFAQHSGVPVAAMMLVWGMGLVPEPGVFKRALVSSWTYMAVIYGVNGILKTNYGFLNEKPSVSTLFDYMGPWPFYLITLQVVAFGLYALLLIPFWRKHKRERGE